MEIVNKTFYIDPAQLGDTNNNFKGNRPLYILCELDEKNYFAVISTTTLSKGKRKTFQNKKYIMWSKKSGLRLCLQYGYHIITKEYLLKCYRQNPNDLRNEIIINDKDIEKLKIFYGPIIRMEYEIRNS